MRSVTPCRLVWPESVSEEDLLWGRHDPSGFCLPQFARFAVESSGMEESVPRRRRVGWRITSWYSLRVTGDQYGLRSKDA